MPTYQEFTDSKVITADRIQYMDGLLTVYAEKGFFYYLLEKNRTQITVSSSKLEALEHEAFLDFTKETTK